MTVSSLIAAPRAPKGPALSAHLSAAEQVGGECQGAALGGPVVLGGRQHAGVQAVAGEAGQEVLVVLGLHGLQLPGVGEAGVGAGVLARQREPSLDCEGAGHLVLTQNQEP